MAAYRQALEIEPDFADVWEGLSMALCRPRPLRRGDRRCRARRRADPEEQLSYTNISRIYQKAGDVPKAEEWAAKGRMLDWKQQLKPGKPPSEWGSPCCGRAARRSADQACHAQAGLTRRMRR